MITFAEIITLPTHYVSVCIVPDGDADAYQVTVKDGATTISTTMHTLTAANVDSIKSLHFIPVAFHAPRGSDYTFQVAGYLEGVATGAVSASTAINSSPGTSRARAIRQMIYQYLKVNPVVYDGATVRISEDRMGRPRTIEKFLAVAGPVIAIGVAYASSDHVDDSTTQEQVITVPVTVMGKGDDPDEAESLVDIAETIRALLDGLPLNCFGCDEKRWTCQAPETVGAQKRTVLQMTLEMNAWRDRGSTIAGLVSGQLT